VKALSLHYVSLDVTHEFSNGQSFLRSKIFALFKKKKGGKVSLSLSLPLVHPCSSIQSQRNGIFLIKTETQLFLSLVLLHSPFDSSLRERENGCSHQLADKKWFSFTKGRGREGEAALSDSSSRTFPRVIDWEALSLY
jgi:hypothetical protein